MKKIWWWLAIGVLVGALAIRIFQLTQSPPAPYWEEVALGYDAYALLKTGQDHHGNPWPTVAFESFGDWKPSGYFYALLPFIHWFGLSVFSVRLLSVVAGVGIVAGVGVLICQLAGDRFNQLQRRWLALLALFISALSPWLIQFSRAAWEANLATLLITWGVVFGWQAVVTEQQQKRRFVWLLLSIASLFGAMYSYHSARILAPALGLLIGWLFIRQDWQGRMKNVWLVGYILPLFMTAFLLRPFTEALGTPALSQRLAETSVFSDLAVIEESNRLRALQGDSLLSRVIYHRYLLFGGEVASQFFSHFTLDFLFITGDANPRHSTQYFGLFYPFEVVFLLVGAGWALRHLSTRQKQLLSTWLIFGILPAAMTRTTPHALRILPAAPVFLLAITLGAWQVLAWLKKETGRVWPLLKKRPIIWPTSLVIVYLLFFAAVYRHLLTVYPQRYATEWQYGYQQLVETVEKLRLENPDLPVYITREQGRPAMYYWFYTQTDPVLVQQANEGVKKDQGEFLEFANLHFVRSLDEVSATPAIVAGSPGEIMRFQQLAKPQPQANLTVVTDLAGQAIWSVAVIN